MLSILTAGLSNLVSNVRPYLHLPIVTFPPQKETATNRVAASPYAAAACSR